MIRGFIVQPELGGKYLKQIFQKYLYLSFYTFAASFLGNRTCTMITTSNTFNITLRIFW